MAGGLVMASIVRAFTDSSRPTTRRQRVVIGIAVALLLSGIGPALLAALICSLLGWQPT